MKRFLTLLIAVFIVSLVSWDAFAFEGKCSAKAAILYQPDTQSVLYEKNIYDKYLVASTTKILTALVVLENASDDEMVEILPSYADIEGSSMYLKPGERFTVKELLYGLILVSGNDAAVALAHHVAGDIESFAELMNAKAEELGCANSNFVNPHGLDEDDHYSSAYDLALIMTAAMDNEIFVEITGTKNIALGGRTLVNHNKLLWSCEGVNGGKTGYTMAAGRTLVSSCERNGMKLVCVTISDSNDWNDHSNIYDWGYTKYQLVCLEDEFKIPVISGERAYVTAKCDELVFLADKDENIQKVFNIPKFIYAPVLEGQVVGTVRCFTEKRCMEREVRLTESVEIDESVPLGFWEQLKWSWYYYNEHSGNIPFVPMY